MKFSKNKQINLISHYSEDSIFQDWRNVSTDNLPFLSLHERTDVQMRTVGSDENGVHSYEGESSLLLK